MGIWDALKLNVAVTPLINYLKRYLPCGRVGVAWLVNHFWLEDLSGLLCDALPEELVVDLDAGNVALVAWDDGSLALIWALQ